MCDTSQGGETDNISHWLIIDNLENFANYVQTLLKSFNLSNCDDWNRLPGWVINGESVNKFKGDLDNFFMDNRGFK